MTLQHLQNFSIFMKPITLQQLTCCTVTAVRLIVAALATGIIIASLVVIIRNSHHGISQPAMEQQKTGPSNLLLQSEGKLEALKAQLQYDPSLRKRMLSKDYNEKVKKIQQMMGDINQDKLMRLQNDNKVAAKLKQTLLKKVGGQLSPLKALLQGGHVQP